MYSRSLFKYVNLCLYINPTFFVTVAKHKRKEGPILYLVFSAMFCFIFPLF